MRGSLNNPWIVGGLCVVAVGVIFWQWMRGAMATSGPPAAEPAQALVTSEPAVQSTPPAPGPTHMEISGMEQGAARVFKPQTWVGTLARDPFQPVAEASPEIEREHEIKAPVSSPPAQSLHLEAVTVEGERRFAVINHAIVSEGDQVEGYHVVRIESGGVTVEGEGGQQQLVFGREMGTADDR